MHSKMNNTTYIYIYPGALSVCIEWEWVLVEGNGAPNRVPFPGNT